MPTPTIPDGELFMNATLWTGNGGTQTITNGAPGQSFQPNLIWIKSRSDAYNNFLTDSVRGASKYLISNSAAAEDDAGSAGITAFNTNGFSMGSGTALNANGATYVGWQWKAGSSVVTNTAGSITSQVNANTTSGFSILTYTGTGATGGTIGHGLGVAPSFIVVKNRTSGFSWVCYHSALSANQYFYLDRTDAADTIANVWGSGPTSTTFGVWANAGAGNNQPNPYIAYCWSQIDGYSRFGSYVGNGTQGAGPFIYLGFRPKYVLVKNVSVGGRDWHDYDSSRSPFNYSGSNILKPNTAGAELTGRNDVQIDMLSNGFRLIGNDAGINENGATFIYICFAENPLKYANAR